MDCSKNRRLDMTPHEEFAPCHTHPSHSPPIRTSSVLEASGEVPKKRRQVHESI